ncbi:MAG: hypothetical protein HN353_00085 [Bdellovibrionales bacterium]|nr:hypothetical protein [Bdellovibrionales bacterium]MBT3525481.1 hypothetical protein [Bdellovibrionales bacterium]MBT7670246.1 hypothetical protein [Bdellovibrionales bacterium]MBT7767386.1 hypothetical protein [Bdellovibrionales bacterium]
MKITTILLTLLLTNSMLYACEWESNSEKSNLSSNKVSKQQNKLSQERTHISSTTNVSSRKPASTIKVARLRQNWSDSNWTE